MRFEDGSVVVHLFIGRVAKVHCPSHVRGTCQVLPARVDKQHRFIGQLEALLGRPRVVVYDGTVGVYNKKKNQFLKVLPQSLLFFQTFFFSGKV